MMPTAVRSDCGQVSIAPSGVADQSVARSTVPILPPPAAKSNRPAFGVPAGTMDVRMDRWFDETWFDNGSQRDRTSISSQRFGPGSSLLRAMPVL